MPGKRNVRWLSTTAAVLALVIATAIPAHAETPSPTITSSTGTPQAQTESSSPSATTTSESPPTPSAEPSPEPSSASPSEPSSEPTSEPSSEPSSEPTSVSPSPEPSDTAGPPSSPSGSPPAQTPTPGTSSAGQPTTSNPSASASPTPAPNSASSPSPVPSAPPKPSPGSIPPDAELYPEGTFAPVKTAEAAQVQALYAALRQEKLLENTVAVTTAKTTDATRQLDAARARVEPLRAAARTARDEANAAIRDLYLQRRDTPIPDTPGMRPASRGSVSQATELARAADTAEQTAIQAERDAHAADEALTALRKQLDEQRRALEVQKKSVSTLRAQVDAANRSAVQSTQGTPVSGQNPPAAGQNPPTTGQPYQGGKLAQAVPGQLTSEFGNRFDPYYHVWQLHAGIDIAAAMGTPITASAAGTVTYAGWNGGYGNYVCIEHGPFRNQVLSTCYGHMSQIQVKVGQKVAAGQVIGLVGSTGASTGPHLHFEVRLDGRPVDPLPWL